MPEHSSIKTCAICGDIIPEDFEVPSEIQLCPKTRCWEVFLPVDLRKKYFPGQNSRFEILKRKINE